MPENGQAGDGSGAKPTRSASYGSGVGIAVGCGGGGHSSSSRHVLQPVPEAPRLSSPSMRPLRVDVSARAVSNPGPRPGPDSTQASPTRASNLPPLIRAVTPEPAVDRDNHARQGRSAVAFGSRNLSAALSSPKSPSRQPSPAGADSGARRQGVVFKDADVFVADSAVESPTASPQHSRPPPPLPPTSFRPRTHILESVMRHGPSAPPTGSASSVFMSSSVDTRHCVGSLSSATSHATSEDSQPVSPSPPSLQPPLELYANHGSSTAAICNNGGNRLPEMPKERKPPTSTSTSTRSRLSKRVHSHPASPPTSPSPSIDSLPIPVPTADANKVLLLMKNLCGRMRGGVVYQNAPGAPWRAGVCYIDEQKGSMMFDPGDNGPFHVAVVPDLRGCRVLPVDVPEGGANGAKCLEIAGTHSAVTMMLRPSAPQEFDLWLAALLCWQQTRPYGSASAKLLPNARSGGGGGGGGVPPATRSEMRRRTSSSGLKDASIIKVGKILLWDKGLARTPRAIVRRPSTRDLRSTQPAWRRVSCILQDNGEFKLMTENDVTVLSVIELSQLSRASVQQLNRSVLEEDFCIAIFPIYASTSTRLSIFRPIYIALDSRVLFEVWFVLLRAFAVPDIYLVGDQDQLLEVAELDAEPTGEIFRVEKYISIRVTEAKLKTRPEPTQQAIPPPPPLQQKHPQQHPHQPQQPDPLVGNYLAEVILDGEIRARTTIKTDTRTPFWREDCNFSNLPATLPYLSIILKRVDGNPEDSSLSHQPQASPGLARTGQLTEISCGAVDLALSQMACGKDHEQWHPIYDDREQAIGSMLLKVHHEELVVLLSREYQPLSETLHRFSSGLTAQITEALPGSLRRMAEILLNIFQVSGSATEWLTNMVEDEIDGVGTRQQAAMKRKHRFSQRLRSNDSFDSASEREQQVRDLGKSLQGEANLLFRGNSLLTQAFEFHMRRLGKDYLEEILADRIAEINELNPNCEVDPSKVQAGDDLQQHWAQLLQLTGEIWTSIAASAGRLPAELRHILKYIRGVADSRYGDFLRPVTYTSVSGFLFLRFICPAILNPKLFGLLRDHPRPRAQRTLILITKGLQALANLSNIGKKETWMDPMNRFLLANRESFKDFIDAVCSIPAQQRGGGGPVLPASYSSPIAILGRLSPVAREGFPALPYLIDRARNFASLAKLWAETNRASAQGTDPAQLYDGDLLEFHHLCVDLHRRAAACYARVEGLRAAEAAAMPTKDHLNLAELMQLGTLLDSSVDIGTFSPQATPPADGPWGDGGDSASSRPPGSSGSDMDGAHPHGPSASRGYMLGRARPALGTATRQASGGSDLSSNAGGVAGGVFVESGGVVSAATTRNLRHNGLGARKFLSGFIRKTRTASPDAASATAPGGGKIFAPLSTPSPAAITATVGAMPGAGGKEARGHRDRDDKDADKGRHRDRDTRDTRDRERGRDKEAKDRANKAQGFPEPYR